MDYRNEIDDQIDILMQHVNIHSEDHVNIFILLCVINRSLRDGSIDDLIESTKVFVSGRIEAMRKREGNK